MTPNPILRVLSTLSTHDVRFLLMGGQACVFYEGTDFSIDTDIVIVADAANLDRLRSALDELEAKVTEYLKRGHAIHFRCFNPAAEETRLDVWRSCAELHRLLICGSDTRLRSWMVRSKSTCSALPT